MARARGGSHFQRRWRLYVAALLAVAALVLTAIGVNNGWSALRWSSNLTHAQQVWLAALEWCESSGVPAKVNPKDLDGTPSYYSFQFKPSTFKQFGIKYGLFSDSITDEEVRAKLDDYALQKKMVATMINDPSVLWGREFPACVRQLGRPPADF